MCKLTRIKNGTMKYIPILTARTAFELIRMGGTSNSDGDIWDRQLLLPGLSWIFIQQAILTCPRKLSIKDKGIGDGHRGADGKAKGRSSI